MITAWWAGLSLAMKVIWGITLAASLIFIIQTIATFIGADMDVDTDFDTDVPGDIDPGMNLLTFRNFINFFLGFGWTTILLKDKIESNAVLLLVAFLVGMFLVLAVMYLFKWLSGMQQSGNIDIYKSAPGCQGTVYLTVPGERKGEGIVQISINGAVREYHAMTDEDEIKTGTPVKVVEAINDSTVL
ncbi:MAG: hypothetical protein K6C37_02675, partial [Bacteroidales bacterium]|nr:hypothetical protein [Bacteroidales bacterium]